MNRESIPVEVIRARAALGPLKLVFWGGALAILDFRITLRLGSEVGSVNLLPDFLGLGILLVGLARIAWAKVDSVYETIMAFVFGVCCAWALGSVLFTVRPDLLPRVPWIGSLIGPLAAVCVAGFFHSMERLSRCARAGRSEDAWRRVTLGAVGLIIVPQAIAAIVAARAAGPEQSPDLLVLVSPLITLLSLTGWCMVFWALRIMSKEVAELVALPSSRGVVVG